MAEKTEKVKKAKAPAKPRATAGTVKKSSTKKTTQKKNGAVENKAASYIPTHAEVAALALQYWVERGREHGQHVQDWLRAERELMKMAS